MAIWYMVKRLDTGEINGHNTWRYTPVSSTMVNIGQVGTQERNGKVHHLMVYVDGRDYDDALLMAETSFRLHETEEAP